MNITILCSDPKHPVNDHLVRWQMAQQDHHKVTLCRDKSEMTGGDILFLISCSQIITAEDRANYAASLVIHASDLPRGRGWSPHIWQILDGETRITCSLLEAEDKVDSGRIWKKISFHVPETALWDEINVRLFDTELALMDFAVAEFDTIAPQPQDENIEPTYYQRRTMADSELDPDQPLRVLFNQIRVCDTNRFPAFFDHLGQRYILKLEKADD